MEKVFFIMPNTLEEVNQELSKGGKVKFISPTHDGQFAYVVIEYEDN